MAWALGLLALPGLVSAAEGGFPLDRAPKKTTDLGSLQNGAKLFVNYCLGCHSASFQRYNRLTDLGLSEQDIKDNLMFTTTKIGETMKAAISPEQAKEWFGTNPPDLTLIARSRASAHGTGADYLYTFLRTFYRDDAKATGWNNLAFPNTAMPNPLWQLQGVQAPVWEAIEQHGHTAQVFKDWKTVKPGTMSSVQFDDNVGDLVNFLQWMGEPVQNQRVRIGVGALIFLLIFTLFAWRLNAAYWKNVK